MARGTLHAPKPDGARRRRNAPAHGEQVVHRDGLTRGPEIEAATGSSTWSDATRMWWADWRSAPQSALFEVTDWRRLALLAVMVEGYFRRPSAAALSEIRMNEERLGATITDRMRARIRIEDSEDAEVVSLRTVPSRREDLAARLGGEDE